MPAANRDGHRDCALVELSEADSKKWLSLLRHPTSDQLVETQPTPPTGYAHSYRRALKQQQTRLGDTQTEDLVAGYLSGSTVYELAAQFGCHRNTVSRLLKSRGIALRLVSMTDEQIVEAVDLYESGLSLAHVGSRLGFDRNTVRLRLIERGVEMRDSHGRVKHLPHAAYCDSARESESRPPSSSASD